MTDHETFLTLASRQLHEDLSKAEDSALREHLAACPACRSLVAEMRSDDARLRTVLVVDDPVAPGVRRRVLEEAAGQRRLDPRLALAIAATLVLAILGLAAISGGAPGPAVPPASTPPPSKVPSPTATSSPVGSPSATATLSGVYTYSVFGGPGRGVSITAQQVGSAVTGRWSLWHVGENPDQTDGSVTCLVVRGREAFAFGTADDGGPAAFFWVHDGGKTSADRAMTWVQDPGEAASELEGWCRNAGAGYGQLQPVPLTSGDVIVEPAGAAASPSAASSANGAYAYSVSPGAMRPGLDVRAPRGASVGEWSHMNPANGTSYGGPVTCLVIDGHDAWLARPATPASDGSVGRAAFIYVHDGGQGGKDDPANLWMNDRGRTLSTMEGWCESRFIPAVPFPLNEGDVTVDAGGG